MIETAVHIAKRRNPSGKICCTVRWFQAGHYRGHACGPHKETAYEYRRQKRWELKQGISDDICAVSWERFVAEHVANIPGKNHGDLVRQTLKQFGEMFHPSGPHAVSFGMVEEFQRRLRLLKEGNGGKLLSPHTINGKLRRLKHALTMAEERRHIRRSPMGKRFRFEPVEELDPVQVPDEWKQAVLDACPTLMWKAFLYLLTTTGCRRGEIIRLAWEQVHLEGAFIRLTKTKTRRVRLQPLVPSAVDLLGRLHADVPKMVDSGREAPKEPLAFRALKFNVHREFNRIRDRATLDDGLPVPFFRMKDLRSSAGTDAADEQFSEFNVASFLGHADSKVTAKHYIKRKLDAKRQLAEALASKLNIAWPSASLGEVDIDVPEVALEPLAGIMPQRDERLPLAPAMPTDIPANLVVSAGVAMLITQTPEDLSGRVALLTRRLLVRLQDLVDDRRQRPQLRRRWVLRACVGPGLRTGQDLPNLPPRVMQSSSDSPKAHPIPMRPAYTSVVVHREHPLPPDWLVLEEKNQHPKAGRAWKPPAFVIATVGPFYAPISQELHSPGWVPITRRLPEGIDDPKKSRRIVTYLASCKTPGREQDRLAELDDTTRLTVACGSSCPLRRNEVGHPRTKNPEPQASACAAPRTLVIGIGNKLNFPPLIFNL